MSYSLIFILLVIKWNLGAASLVFYPQDLVVEIGYQKNFTIQLTEEVNDTVRFKLIEDVENLVNLSSHEIILDNFNNKTDIVASALHAGHVIVSANVSNINTDDAFIRIRVSHSNALDIISTVVGWIYFVAWTVSFYPQMYENYKRKSVIGLSFDFLYLNFLGHLSYGLFNIALFWIPKVKGEFHEQYPKGVNQVQLNDVIFSLHAIFATFVTILQTFIYEKGNSTISKICKCLLSLMLLFILICLILTLSNVMIWLMFFNMLSNLKLLITLLKYCPQAYLNFKRKSTEGWSIGNILCDFTGGSLSIVQMFLISYNYNDWKSIFGDFTKFGLGVFSVAFDILFIVQHYILYRRHSYVEYENEVSTDGFDNEALDKDR